MDEKARKWVAGFDPGGEGRFGWCLAESLPEGRLVVRDCGLVSSAPSAVEEATEAIPEGSMLIAAGIDSPLYWSLRGDRRADALVRARICRLGAAGGTVQHVNRLQGAGLVQGILVAHLLREKTPSVRLTESHPKALLWLLRVARATGGTQVITVEDLIDYFGWDAAGRSEHERDASLAAYAAWAMINRTDGWRDLLPEEDSPFFPIPDIVYWMPWRCSSDRARA